MTEEDVKKLLGKKISYPISLEIAGELAMWAREDSGSEKTSGVYPPFSQAKGIFEKILYMPSATVIPLKVQICSEVIYKCMTFNYHGEKRKVKLIKEGNPAQIRATVLYKPCYRIFGCVVNSEDECISAKSSKYKGINHAHSYQEQFNRRLKRGQNCGHPALGWEKCLATYVGPFRAETKVQESINMTISSVTFTCFDSLINGKWDPSFSQNVKIEKGEVLYVKRD